MIGFDQLVDEAWPATHTEEFDSWRLRYAGGVTKRANSVWPAGEPDDVEAAIEAAERFYAERGLPAVFSISENAHPEKLDRLLAQRGYELVDPTLIMTADLSEERPVTREVETVDAPSAGWLQVWWSVDGRYATDLATAKAIVTGVAAVYATAGEGVGRAVPQGDWLGIYCMAVPLRARRRGLAREVLHALLNDGRARGAYAAYLCVTSQNTGARALYEQAGFQVSGGYHYRVRQLTAS